MGDDIQYIKRQAPRVKNGTVEGWRCTVEGESESEGEIECADEVWF